MSAHLKPREQQLAGAVELALANYLGTDSFPSEEWPKVALAFTQCVVATGITTIDKAEAAREVLQALQGFTAALHDIVE